jgi:hypothetical protein
MKEFVAHAIACNWIRFKHLHHQNKYKQNIKRVKSPKQQNY